MAGASLKPDEVYLNGKLIRIRGPVSRFRASAFPQKQVLGDFNDESDPILSTITWRDWRGGQGQEVGDNINRFWISNLNTHFAGHLTLPAFHNPADSSTVGVDPLSGPVIPQFVAEFYNKLFYASVDDNGGSTNLIRKNTSLSSPTAGLWSTSNTIADEPTDFGVFEVNGARTLVTATANSSGAIHYTTSNIASTVAETWDITPTTTPTIKYVTSWRDMLWGVDNSGGLHFATALSSTGTTNPFTEVAKFQGNSSAITGIFTGPGRTEDELLYLTSANGLHVYDNENERILDTPLQFQGHPNVGRGVTWRGSIFVPAGLSIFRYTPGAVSEIASVGLDRDDGLPQEHRGTITALGTSNNDLLALVNRNNSSANSALYGFDGQSWHQIWEDWNGTTGFGVGKNLVAMTANSSFYAARFAIADSDSAIHGVQSVDLPIDLRSPTQLGTAGNRYAITDSADPRRHTTSWVQTKGNQDWLAVTVQTDVSWGESTDTSLKLMLDYGLNIADTDSWIPIQTRDAGDGGGEKSSIFTTNDGEPLGKRFNTLRFRVSMESALTSVSPDMNSMVLTYLKTPKPQWGYRFVVDATKNGKQSPQEVLAMIEDIFGEIQLSEFEYKDTPTPVYVTLYNIETNEKPGFSDQAAYTVTLVQVTG